MALNYTKWAVKCKKWLENIPTFFIPRPSKIYPNWNFWFANVTSGNPASQTMERIKLLHH
jgi:hypothetical protein